MTLSEFNNQFDLLYNNITSNQAPGLDEYEKSVFLTKAQEELIKSYYLPVSNPVQQGYDDNPKRQVDFSSITEIEHQEEYINPDYPRLNSKARLFNNALHHYPIAILNQSITVNDSMYVVVPITYTDYDRIMTKPYKMPPKGQVWSIITNNNGYSVIEIIGLPKGKAKYTVRYIRIPKPIILVKLDGVSIRGEVGPSVSELPEELHEEILQRAVALAKMSWLGIADSNDREKTQRQ